MVVARCGFLDIVQTLIARDSLISSEALGRSVIFAASNGHSEIVKALLAKGDISEASRFRALKAAAEREHFDVLEILARP